jgi:LacI family transcriptional regulator
MRDVAARAGVSFKTVSRVVNDEPGVSTALRQRVQAAALELNYRHNLAASNLRRTAPRTATVGALLQDLGNSFSAGLLRALENRLRERGIAVLAASLDEEPDRERELVHDLVARRVDGLVLMPASSSQEYLVSERRAGLPTVFVDRRPSGVDADSVTVDNRAGARLATRHLLDVGHRRIAFLGDLARIDTATTRALGFTETMREAGVDGVGDLVRLDLRSPALAEAALCALMAQPDPPTAVFAGRNDLSIGAVRALRQLGLSRRVAVVGFDDFPLADVLDPPLTVVRQDVGRVGNEVGRLLFGRLDGDTSSPVHVVLEPVLVQRGSGEIPPA